MEPDRGEPAQPQTTPPSESPSQLPSEPPEPSEPSGPSAPSGTSGPSETSGPPEPAEASAAGASDADQVADVPSQGTVVPVDLRDYVSFSLDQATRVRTLSTPGLALDQWCLEPQQSTGVLQYPGADVVHTVLGGRAWFVTEQGEVGLDPLGAVLVPAGTVHGIDNRGTDPLIVVTAMAPPDRLPVHTPDAVEERAIRDDEQYGALGRAVRDGMQRLFRR